MPEERLLVSVPGTMLRDALGPVPDGVDVIVWDMDGPAPVDAIDIVVPPYLSRPSVLAGLAGVRTRLIQGQLIGYDGVAQALPSGHVYANAATVHETSTAELALALILASQRGIPSFVRSAEKGRWAPEWRESLADRVVLILGFGGVGTAVEKRLLPFEVTVVRVASRARDAEGSPVHGIDELFDLLPGADIVVVSVPLTASTERMIDDRFLSAMADGALLVNVARGRVADPAALLDHATRGRLRFALDVTDPEPLPEGHPLFALPNVLISPHAGGASTAMIPRMARLLRWQIERMLDGEKPLGVVIRS